MTAPPLTVSAARELLHEVLDDIENLVAVESPSDDLEALKRSATGVENLLSRRLGQRPERVDIQGVPHLRLRLGSGPRTVLLVGHHDTVWPLGTASRLPFGIEKDIMRGPGTFDMKTGVVMAVHALAVLAVERPEALDGVTLLITGDEELGSPTSRDLIEAEARESSAALVLEAAGDGGALKISRKGVAQYVVEIEGVAAHAGLEPERGANAAIETAHQVLAIAELGASARGTTVTPTVTSAGTTANTVPAAGSIHVDARSWTTREQERVDAQIRRLTARDEGCSVRVLGGINRPPLERERADQLFNRAQQLATVLGLRELPSTSVGGASDGNFTAAVGTPTLDGLGAVGGGAHADSEHVLIDQLPDRLALLAALIADLGADPVS